MFQASGFRLQAKSYTKHVACSMQPAAGRSFTFVELMITVVILLVGLVAIIQGFITATSALNTSHNYILLMPFLENKMQDLEALLMRKGKVQEAGSGGDFSSDSRNFTWRFTATEIKNNDTPDLSKDLKEAQLEVLWKERNLPRDLSIVTYFKIQDK